LDAELTRVLPLRGDQANTPETQAKKVHAFRRTRGLESMIETFMWGYWGWGGSTPELVKAFDAAEAQRGFERPIFVDARVRREGRAVGFRGNAFETLLGGTRYRWMRGLGNQAILDGGETRLADPKTVGELLDLAVESHRLQRRVIFFCACKAPRSGKERTCHRDLVAELLVKEARRRDRALCY
jgi:hypothetical protein